MMRPGRRGVTHVSNCDLACCTCRRGAAGPSAAAGDASAISAATRSTNALRIAIFCSRAYQLSVPATKGVRPTLADVGAGGCMHDQCERGASNAIVFERLRASWRSVAAHPAICHAVMASALAGRTARVWTVKHAACDHATCCAGFGEVKTATPIEKGRGRGSSSSESVGGCPIEREAWAHAHDNRTPLAHRFARPLTKAPALLPCFRATPLVSARG